MNVFFFISYLYNTVVAGAYIIELYIKLTYIGSILMVDNKYNLIFLLYLSFTSFFLYNII